MDEGDLLEITGVDPETGAVTFPEGKDRPWDMGQQLLELDVPETGFQTTLGLPVIDEISEFSDIEA